MKKQAVSIIIADDHPVVRDGIKSALTSSGLFTVVKETGDGKSALKWISELKPDVALMDIEMPEMDGFAVTRALRESNSTTRVIMITMHNDEATFDLAMELGVNGFVLKENAITDIGDAIQAVMAGKYYLSPSLSDYIMRQKTGAENDATGQNGIESLTPTERKILRLIAEQKTTRAIAEELFNSPKTIEKHRSNICSKLGLRGSYALLKFVFDNKSLI